MNNKKTHHLQFTYKAKEGKAMTEKGNITITLERNGDKLDIAAEQNIPDEYLISVNTMILAMTSQYIAKLRGITEEKAAEIILSQALFSVIEQNKEEK